MKRIMFVVLIALVAAATLFAAGTTEQAGSKVESARGGEQSKFIPAFGTIPAPSKVYRIGVMEKTLINDFWLDAKNGFEDAARDYGVEVEVFAAPTESDLQAQANTMSDMLAKQFDMLCVSPITDTNLLKPLAKATQMGIPIINSIDAHIDEENQEKHNIDISAFITVDFKENTRMSVRFIAEKLNGAEGKMIHLMGLPGGRCAEERKMGYEEELALYPNMTNVGIYNTEWDRKKAMDITADVLQSHPDLKGIVACNDDCALGAYQAVKNAGLAGKVYITGVDATPDGIKSIMRGELSATTAFFQYGLAYSSIEAAILLLEDQFDGKPTVVYGPQEIWDAENVTSKVSQYREMYVGLKDL
jgi:ABC-type sugar transport system substrate-binding protein